MRGLPPGPRSLRLARHAPPPEEASLSTTWPRAGQPIAIADGAGPVLVAGRRAEMHRLIEALAEQLDGMSHGQVVLDFGDRRVAASLVRRYPPVVIDA